VASNALWAYDPVKKHAVTQAGSAAFTYSYDANGNAITRNGQSIGWDAYNYPTLINNSASENVTLSYNGNHQRWKQVYVNAGVTETTHYIGGLLEKVNVGGVDDYRHYIYGGGTTAVALMSRTSSGVNSTRYLLVDHQQSPASIRDASGNLVVNESFTAYGARRNPSTWSGAASSSDLNAIAAVSRQGYSGQTALGNLGLNHMNGRVQDAVTGVFLSADPYLTEPGNTQNYNRYSYVYNNPLSNVDPSGFGAVPFNPWTDCLWTDSTTYYCSPQTWAVDLYTCKSYGSPSCPFSGPTAFAKCVVGCDPGRATSTFAAPPSSGGSYGGPATCPPGKAFKCNASVQAQGTPCSLVAPTGQYGLSAADYPDARFDPTTAAMLSDALANLNAQGIVPVITSGYRPPNVQAAQFTNAFALNLAPVSWHEAGQAVDFGPNNNRGNMGAITAALTQSGFVWGGTFVSPGPDPRHFQSQPAGTRPSAALVAACFNASGAH
jgi:RHS repeat-associated protein